MCECNENLLAYLTRRSSHALGDPLVMMISNFNSRSCPFFWKAEDFSTKHQQLSMMCYPLTALQKPVSQWYPVGTSSALRKCIARLFSLAPACCSAGVPGDVVSNTPPMNQYSLLAKEPTKETPKICNTLPPLF